MTHTQSLMLAVCFGATIGTFVGNITAMIWLWFDNRKYKKSMKEKHTDRK